MASIQVDNRRQAGRFGPYGGRYVPETLVAALDELAMLYDSARSDPAFWHDFDVLAREYVGRPTPLSPAPRLSAEVGARVLLKREDLNHTGAHKINNAIGQALLALRMGKRRIIAETGAGQHGVATATVCARFGRGGDGCRGCASRGGCGPFVGRRGAPPAGSNGVRRSSASRRPGRGRGRCFSA